MLIGNIYVSLDWKTDFGSRIWLDNFRNDGRPGWLWDGKKNWMQVHHKGKAQHQDHS